jgi:hypothetical protein
VTPTGKGEGGKGVRIRTSKEERVNGLSPTATAALGCLLGWSDAGKDMLAGTARNAMEGRLELPVGRNLTPWPPLRAVKGPVDNSPPTPAPGIPARVPINFADTVNDGRDLLMSLVNRVSSNLADAGSRWMDGMTRTDVADITTQTSKDLREWSLEVYDKAKDNVKPPKEGANNG